MPIGSRPGQNRRAASSLISTTGAHVGHLRVVNDRPRLSGMRMAGEIVAADRRARDEWARLERLDGRALHREPGHLVVVGDGQPVNDADGLRRPGSARSGS